MWSYRSARRAYHPPPKREGGREDGRGAALRLPPLLLRGMTNTRPDLAVASDGWAARQNDQSLMDVRLPGRRPNLPIQSLA